MSIALLGAVDNASEHSKLAASHTATGSDPLKQIDGYLADTKVTAKVKARILDDNQFKVSSLSVNTKQGNVLVSGFVNSSSEIHRLKQVISKIYGVKQVKQHLRVRQGAPVSLKRYASDLATTSEALTLLFASSHIDSENIHVSTRHNEIFLSGIVPTAEQKQRAEAVMKNIHSVRKVKNELQVNSGTKIK